jgi:hypothetical protein
MSNLERSKYIGGYDCSCILGYNPYRPKLLVWHDKVYGVERDLNNPHIDRGNTMEPIVEAYLRERVDPSINSPDVFRRFDAEAKAGGPVSGTANQILLVDEQQDFVGGHPDGIGDDCVYEIKCPTMRKIEMLTSGLGSREVMMSVDEIYRGGLPLEWVLQVQHYMMVTGQKKGCIAIWDYDNWAPFLFYMDADVKLHERLREEYEIFWQYVLMGIEPPSDTQSELEQMTLIIDPSFDAICADYRAAYEGRYNCENAQKVLKSSILTYAGDRATIITENHVVSISDVKTPNFSYKRLVVKDRNEA